MLDKPIQNRRNALSFTARAFIADLLSGLCTKDGKYAVYAPGWSDAQVAKRAAQSLGHDVTAANIAGVRKPLYGVLRDHTLAAPREPGAGTLEARVARLEADLDRLRSALGAW